MRVVLDVLADLRAARILEPRPQARDDLVEGQLVGRAGIVVAQRHVGRCLWNTTPLQNQVSSGWVMMIAGLPGMALALVQLMAWLIQLADSGTVEEKEGSEL